MTKILFILTTILILPSPSVGAQSLDKTRTFGDGIAAYSLQQYERAREIWIPLAGEDNYSAQYRLALLYESGLGVEQDDIQAHYWYLKSAEGGYTPSQLALAYSFSIGRGVVEDPYQAFEWYLIAAENGEAKAQYHVGILFVLGEVVSKNLSDAFFWITIATLNFNNGPERNRALTLLKDVSKLMTGEELISAKEKINEFQSPEK